MKSRIPIQSVIGYLAATFRGPMPNGGSHSPREDAHTLNGSVTPASPFKQFMNRAVRGPMLTNSIGRKAMTRERLQSLILQGFGQGRGDRYKPWIRVTRGNAPRQSNHLVLVTSVQSRPLHLLSQLEAKAARLAAWLGAAEIREQFALFPWAGGPHPMACGCPLRDRELPTMPGLLDISARMGIRHGTYVGAPDLPYVATTDLLITLQSQHGERLVLWSCKPYSVLTDAKKGPRARERIQLERAFAHAIGATHAVYDGTHVGIDMTANLDWLEPTRQELLDAQEVAGREAFARTFNATSELAPVRNRIQQVADALSIDLLKAQRYFRAVAWLTQIDIDLSKPIVMSRPMATGGIALKRTLAKNLMGSA